MPLTPSLNALLQDQATAVRLVGRAALADEDRLMAVKWPEYRFMSALAATKRFVANYAGAHKQCLRKNIDRDKAERSKVRFRIDLTNPNREATQAWQARKAADAHGMPYPLYLEFCFDFAMRRKRHFLPRLNQLQGGEAARSAWSEGLAAFWDDRRKTAYADLPFMPQYQAMGGTNGPARQVFVEQLLDHLRTAVLGPHDAIGHYVLSQGYLTLADCTLVWPEEIVAAAYERALDEQKRGMWSAQHRTLEPLEKVPACAGLPGAGEDPDPVCPECNLPDICSKLKQQVNAMVVQRYGSVEPRLDARRAATRARVQKHRKMKSVAAGIAGPEGPGAPAGLCRGSREWDVTPS